MLDAGVERKVVQKSGSYFSFDDERLGQGRQNATAFLREHPDVTQEILLALQAQIGPEQVVSARLLPSAEGRGMRRRRRAGEGRRARVAHADRDVRSASCGAARSPSSSTVRRWRTLPVDVVVRTRLSVGLELERPRLRELARELRRARAVDTALRAVARRDLSAAELGRRLERRGVSPALRDETVERLEEVGLVDDDRFARRLAESLAERGHGDGAIRWRLEQAGVGPETAGARGRRPHARARARPRDRRGPGLGPAYGAGARPARLRRGRGRGRARTADCGRALSER